MFLRKHGGSANKDMPWPRPGGYFDSVAGLALDAVGNVVVCDGTHRIQILQANATFVTMFGQRDEAGTSGVPFGFEEPISVCVDRIGRMYIADRHRIGMFGFV